MRVLGEAEPSLDAANPISTGHWRELTVAPSGTTKSGADKDAFDRRVEAHIHRFYKEMGETTRRLTLENSIGRLILAGPGERVAEFRRTLPNEVRNRVAEAHIPTGASASEIVEQVTAVQDRVELERENERIAEAWERGVRGWSDTLEASQLGEIYHLLVPWPSEGEVRWCHKDALAVQDVKREDCPYCGEQIRMRPLVDVLVDLAIARAARIDFVRGPNAKVLREEFDGLAGLTRF